MARPSLEDLQAFDQDAVATAAGAGYAEVIRGLDATVPAHAAMLRLAAALFRGATYVAFDGELPELTTHSAVAAARARGSAGR